MAATKHSKLMQSAVLRPLFLAVSSKGSVSRAVSAMRAGAHDFLTKPFSLDALASKITFQLQQRRPVPKPCQQVADRAVRIEAVSQDNLPAPRSVPEPKQALGLDRLIGTSAAMLDIHDQVRRMAPSQAPVFITGESGTGKEL